MSSEPLLAQAVAPSEAPDQTSRIAPKFWWLAILAASLGLWLGLYEAASFLVARLP